MRVSLLTIFALALCGLSGPATAAPVSLGGISAPDTVIAVRHGHGHGHGMRGHRNRGHGHGHGHRRGGHH